MAITVTPSVQQISASSIDPYISSKTVGIGVSIERSDFTGIWDRPVIVKMSGLSIATSNPRKFLEVVDEFGNAIDGAKVRIEDANGIEQVNTITDSSGRAYAKRLWYLDQPAKIKIAKKGYKRYQTEISLDEKIDWTISLENSPYQEEI